MEWAKSAEMVTLSSVLSLLYSQSNVWQTTVGVLYSVLCVGNTKDRTGYVA